MIKNDIALEIEKKSNFNGAKSLLIVETILEALKSALSRQEKVEIRGFGSFKVKKRKARMARNPRTGEEVFVDEHYVPIFKVSKELRSGVDQNLKAKE